MFHLDQFYFFLDIEYIFAGHDRYNDCIIKTEPPPTGAEHRLCFVNVAVVRRRYEHSVVRLGSWLASMACGRCRL